MDNYIQLADHLAIWHDSLYGTMNTMVALTQIDSEKTLWKCKFVEGLHIV